MAPTSYYLLSDIYIFRKVGQRLNPTFISLGKREIFKASN